MFLIWGTGVLIFKSIYLSFYQSPTLNYAFRILFWSIKLSFSKTHKLNWHTFDIFLRLSIFINFMVLYNKRTTRGKIFSRFPYFSDTNQMFWHFGTKIPDLESWWTTLKKIDFHYRKQPLSLIIKVLTNATFSSWHFLTFPCPQKSLR